LPRDIDELLLASLTLEIALDLRLGGLPNIDYRLGRPHRSGQQLSARHRHTPPLRRRPPPTTDWLVERAGRGAHRAGATGNELQLPARHGQNERVIALSRRNALFAGSDEGAENWAILTSLIESCKLHGVNPEAYLTDVLTKLVNNWPNSRLADLTPWG
jgi:hypothetical protein